MKQSNDILETVITEANIDKEIRRMAKEGDPWARIVVADIRGRGLRLSAEQVSKLALDEAVAAAAQEEAVRRLEQSIKEGEA